MASIKIVTIVDIDRKVVQRLSFAYHHVMEARLLSMNYLPVCDSPDTWRHVYFGHVATVRKKELDNPLDS